MSSRSPSVASDDDHDSYHPYNSSTSATAHTTTSKRGRKPAPGSRAVREANRKANHSIIEKRRREKINDTMTALRNLLTEGYVPPAGAEDEEMKAGGKKGQDFKLEVLSRSVDYIRQLLEKVSGLESDLQNERIQHVASTSRCTRCGESDTAAPDNLDDRATKKRKRAATEDVASLSPAAPTAISASRLPSISSLLNPQLPSPPMSAPMYPTIQDIPPILTLPAARSASVSSSSPQRISVSPRSRTGYTPDETHAASVLLHISSKESDTSGSPSNSPIARRDSIRAMDILSMSPSEGGFRPTMTPGGMLGMHASWS